MGAFSEFGVMPEIVKAVEELGWTLPTDVQAEAVPLILGGGDVLMAAETGSGKTGAFSLPVIQIVYETLRDRREGSTKKTASSGLTGWKMNYMDRDPEVGGQYYYEAVVSDEGLCRVGWSTIKSVRELGKDNQSFGFGGTGKKSFSSQFDDYGESFGLNDIIGCFLDLNNCEIRFSKNGRDLGRAFEIPQHLLDVGFFASVTLKNAEMKFNFGDSSFHYPPKGGFVGLSKADSQYVVPGATGVAQFDPKRHSPSAVIVEPSRELAEQTNDTIVAFKRYLPLPAIKELLSVGGLPVKEQITALSRGVDIVTGTPGRLDDLISTKHLDLSQVRFFVLDEADGLLSQGHGELINRIYQQIPKLGWDGKRLQMIVCSATLHSPDVKRLAVIWVDPVKDTSWQGLKQSVQTDGVHRHDNIKPGSQSMETLSEAVKLLKAQYTLKAIQEHKMDQALIFCRTKVDCDNLEQFLLSKGGGSKAMVNEYSCVCLHSDRSPAQRRANLQAFKDGEVRFLICTDVAARGIDVKGIPFVINVTLPDERANYVHRIGRVGRADRMGLAVSLAASVQEKVWYHSCPSRGKNCHDTRLKSEGGCTIWYNEKQYVADVEEHLGETITAVEKDMKVPVNDFDGKVVYGEKRGTKGSLYQAHTDQLAPSVTELADLERRAQSSYLSRRHNKGT